MNLSRSQFRRLLLPAPIFAVLACFAASAAYATSEIEGVWSFNGGAVDIQSQPGGTFRGVVTVPTKFAQCSHPVGEEMWTGMTLQADGSYFGQHQWYFEETCAINGPGPTAWRVLRKPDGDRFLRVCFSEPGSNSQPTIDPSGAWAQVTYKECSDSDALGPTPTTSAEGPAGKAGHISFKQFVGLPTAHQCVRRHTLKIALHNPAYDPLKQVVVRVGRRKVADVRSLKKLKKPIVLKKLPGGTFKLKVLAVTVLDQRLSGSRTYHSCRSGRVSKIKLPRAKHRRHHA